MVLIKNTFSSSFTTRLLPAIGLVVLIEETFPFSESVAGYELISFSDEAAMEGRGLGAMLTKECGRYS